MSTEEFDNMDDVRVTLELDNGTEECRILTIFDVDGQDYIALVPQNENNEDNEDGMVYLYKYFEDSEGNPSIENITSDQEYETVADSFEDMIAHEEVQ